MVEPPLKTIYWTVTNECNQYCKYCWISAGMRRGPELDTNQWLQIFSQVIDMGLERVKITGGEPLLHWQKVKKVLEFLMGHEIGLHIETNGTLICGEHKQDILEHIQMETFSPLSISLDSHIPAQHDKFRGMNGAFEKTLQALDFLKKNQKPFVIVTVIHRKNYTQIEDIIEFVSKIDPLCHQMNTVMPEGRAKVNSEYQLPSEFYAEDLPLLIRKIKRKMEEKVRFNVPFAFSPLDINLRACTVGKEICGLLPNGDIAVCGAGINKRELALGNALEDDIEDVWMNSPIFLTLRKDVFESEGICGNCIFAKYCRGYCRAYTYSIYGRLDVSFPICQTLYEEGIFPERYMIDPDKDCSLRAL